MPYALDINPSASEVSEAINYLLNNFTQGLTSNPNSGEVTGPTGSVVGYLYKYIAIKYADSQDGTVNFSNTPTGRLYYGIRNTNDSTESTNPADYIWNLVTGGFGTTKLLWYAVTGGRQILFAISTLSYNVGYVQDIGVSIDLDVITSSLTSDSFGTTFSPATLQVPYTNVPVFSGVIPRLYGTNAYGNVDFVSSQTDSDSAFVNNTWRIGGSATTGNSDIVQTGITIGNPTDGGSYALWPIPSAMASNSATMAVPVRYRDNAGTIRQAALSTLQFVFNYSGKNATICYALYNGNPTVTGAAITTSGTNVPSTTSFSPASATAFTYAVQNPGPSQAMFQSDGIYDPVANTTNWNTPYLSNLKVGQLSAITADLGTVTAGIVKFGTGTTPSGNNFEINSAGVVWADNFFGTTALIDNLTTSTGNAFLVIGANNAEAIVGAVLSSNSGGNAHGVRGRNNYSGTAGLVGAANGYDFYADGSGTNYGPFTGTHDSLITKGSTFTVGDIVIDEQIIERNGISSTISLVNNSTVINQQAALGVVCAIGKPLSSVEPAVYIESVDYTTSLNIMKPSYYTDCPLYDLMPVNAVGEGQINVCGEGGNIQAGDLICTSSTSGKGMRQSDDLVHSYTVAKSRETVTFTGTEFKQIACIYLCG